MSAEQMRRSRRGKASCPSDEHKDSSFSEARNQGSVMSGDMSDTIEMPALCRPFSLGMLYDCRHDKLIPGITLWDREALREGISSTCKEETSFEIMASDTVSDKLSALKINASLKASLLSGLVKVDGTSASYLNDTKKLRNQARVTLKYSRTTRFEQLSMNHLGTHNMTYRDVFDQGTATHVVTGILYGAQAFLIFDRDVSTSENTQDIQGSLQVMIRKIRLISIDGQGDLAMNDEERENVSKISCTFHGDFALDVNPVTYEDTIKFFTNLPKMLGENGEKAVPVRVWLYPLSKLDKKAARLVRDISEDLVFKTENIIQHMLDLNMQCNDLSRHQVAENFPDMKKKINQFRDHCKQFTLVFQKQLAQILPSIRGGGSEEVALVDILTSREQSPFATVCIDEFLCKKEEELNVVKTYLTMFSGIPVLASESAINGAVLDPGVQYVVGFNFSSLNEEEPYLSDLSLWLQTQIQNLTSNIYEGRKSTPWFKKQDVSKEMRKSAKAFQQFAQANQMSEETRIIISSVPDQSNHGASIYLYEDGDLESTKYEPPAKPNLPIISSKTHNSMELVLKPADIGKTSIIKYNIEYRCAEQETWTTVQTKDNNQKVTITHLQPNSVYQFRYFAVCKPGVSVPSDALENERTHPTSPPDALEVTESSCSLDLYWKEPNTIGHGVTITDYIVEYMQDNGTGKQVWEKENVGKKCENFIIKKLQPMTPYIIRVSAACDHAGHSAPCDDVKASTINAGNIKSKFLEKKHLLKDGNPAVYQLNTDHSNSLYREYSLGKENFEKTNKVILLIGATGTGKTTLINGMANYILGVDWTDSFRFKLIDEVTNTSEAHSQTSTVTAYKMNHQHGYRIPYSLTLIDTPGFGDTRGIAQDKKVTEAMHTFFTSEQGIDQIDVVCFVVQSSLARLTPTQKYIFNSVFSIFGKDIKDNILVLITFSDGERPPVLEAIKSADIPCPLDSNGDPIYFKFNNSALFANNQSANTGFNKMFWGMGQHSMEIFFKSLYKIESKSLKLTKEVLMERKQLEVTLQALHPQIKAGLVKLEEIRKTQCALEQNKDLMKANKNFEYEVEIIVPKQEAITGHFITNCQQCHFTCHYPCAIADDKQKCDCAAMTDGKCNVCPGKCVWSVHFNQKYKWEYEKQRQKKTYEDLKKKYKKASGEVMTTEKIFQELRSDYYEVEVVVTELIDNSSRRLKRLREIALKPDPLSTTEYIELMIQSEQQEAKPGYQERIKSLTDVLEMAKIIQKIQNNEPLLPEEDSVVQKTVSKMKNTFGYAFSRIQNFLGMK